MLHEAFEGVEGRIGGKVYDIKDTVKPKIWATLQTTYSDHYGREVCVLGSKSVAELLPNCYPASEGYDCSLDPRPDGEGLDYYKWLEKTSRFKVYKDPQLGAVLM